MRRPIRGREEQMQRKIVSIKQGVPYSKYEKEIQQQGGKIIEHLPLINALLCEFPANRSVEVAGILSNNPHINRVDDDLPIKIINFFNPYFFFPIRKKETPKQMKQQIGWGVKRINCEDFLTVNPKRRVRVAVIDTGIQADHPDLRDNIKGGINITGNPVDISDPNGHGTHVAGIIGALNNEIGIVGVMPKVDLYAVKVFNSKGEGSLTDIIRGLQWCINNRIKLINMSFGSPIDNPTFKEVFKKAYQSGLIMVAAAGNDSIEHKMQYPAIYPETIAITSLNERNSISNFSSFGQGVDFIAPGDQILSTWNNGGYKLQSGTSMAAPHVTGAIAQILNKWGDLTPDQVKQHLKLTAQQLSLRPEYQGAGLIDVAKALKTDPKVSRYYSMVASYYGLS